MARWWRGLWTAIQYPQPPLSPPQPFHSQSSRYHIVQAMPREVAGRRVSARDREQGRIPAVVFLQSLLDKNPSNEVTSKKRFLTAEKKQIQAILKSVLLLFLLLHYFPSTDPSWVWVLGGHLKMLRSTLKYICPAEQFLKIEVDASNLDTED
ncbi:hypothetical protein SADUNF_Sadunf05G0099900 [Salix dunnii]|uniref:Uncharacterized protein n=1 Tax=Salix dunnii TaxID=1413687 RepID=A0A835K3E2_9ROSI|nr:hypothetical protein SADUNF_Sadunf05G0099900 [Salix dunnii]